MLSIISKQHVAILEAYQDSREEIKICGPFLTNASVNGSKYTQAVEQSAGEVFLKLKLSI